MNEQTAVILARVSSKGQEDGYSLESQLKLLREYCQRKEFMVKKEFRIAETASKNQERKIFTELLQYIKKEQITHLAVEKTDRLTRNLKDAVAVDDWLQDNETRNLHSVKESLVIHKNSKSDVKFMWNIHLAVAKKYTDNLREETMKGWAEKLAQGWMPAPPPPGYMTVLKDGKKIHVPDPDTARKVKKIFKLYLEDEHSVQSICDEMEKVGLKTRKGRPFTKSNAHRMLKNPFYIGKILFDNKEYVGAQEPIISEDLFERVQAKLDNKSPHKKRVHNYPLKGVMTCKYCEKLITWWQVKGYHYGSCQKSMEACKKKKYVREDNVQEQIQECLDNLVNPSPEIMELLIDMINNEYETGDNSKQDKRETTQREIDRYKRMDDMLYDDKLSGEIGRERYAQKHEEFESRINELQSQLLGLEDAQKLPKDEIITTIQLSQEAGSIYSQIEDVQEKRNIITQLFDSMIVNDDSVSVIYTDFVKLIAQMSAEMREIMQTPEFKNLTNKKDLFTRGETSLFVQNAQLRSIWCRRKDLNLHAQRAPGPKPGVSTNSTTPASSTGI